MNISRMEKNLNMRFSRAVEYWLVLHSWAFWQKSLKPYFRKSQKPLIFWPRIRTLWMNRNFFGQTAEYVSSYYHTELSCKESWQPFLSKIEHYWLTNYYRGDFMGPGDRVAGLRWNNLSLLFSGRGKPYNRTSIESRPFALLTNQTVYYPSITLTHPAWNGGW